jgi:hypothetical protein
VQWVVLFVLFFSGTGEINTLKNLSFMIFFVIFTAYEDFYRKYNKLLTLFVSGIILTQYIFSLYYKLVLEDKPLMSRLKWLMFFPTENSIENPFQVRDYNSFYFNVKPHISEWMVLILMGFLSEVNEIFKDKKEYV